MQITKMISNFISGLFGNTDTECKQDIPDKSDSEKVVEQALTANGSELTRLRTAASNGISVLEEFIKSVDESSKCISKRTYKI